MNKNADWAWEPQRKTAESSPPVWTNWQHKTKSNVGLAGEGAEITERLKFRKKPSNPFRSPCRAVPKRNARSDQETARSRMSRGSCYGLTNADWLISQPAAQILPGLLRERVRMAKIKETERVRIPSVPAFFCKSRDSRRKCMREAFSPSHFRGVWASSAPSALRASGPD